MSNYNKAYHGRRVMADKKILILNGPNLNMLGKREPGIYGHKTLADIENECRQLGDTLGMECRFAQSNHEGELVTLIQQATGETDAIILNAGAYTHTSIALYDALSNYDGLSVEVHISNVHARETFRHKSMLTPIVTGVIAGFGSHSYLAAMHAVSSMMADS